MDSDGPVYAKPDELPKNLAKLADNALISTDVWALLQGVEVASVRSNKVRSDRRRRENASRPGDMPAHDKKIGYSPFWYVRSYRAWEAGRPGAGAGGGRPPGTGKPLGPRSVKLPLTCPHCHEEITAKDLEAASS